MKITSSKNNFQFSDNEYGYITMSANQVANFNVGNPLKFDTLSVGNITLDPATYRVTLKKNRTYKLISHILVNYTNNAGGSTFQFYDVTAGAYIGTRGYELPVTYVANNTSTTPAFCIITPTVDTVVDLRLTLSININTIFTTYSHWEIQQINIVSPVIPDPSRDYAYVSPQVDLTVTSTNAGFVLTRGKGVFTKTNNGVWYLEFNIDETLNFSANMDVAITGIVTAPAVQAITLHATGITVIYNKADTSSNTLTLRSSAGVIACQCSGKIELASKPTGYGLPTDV